MFKKKYEAMLINIENMILYILFKMTRIYVWYLGKMSYINCSSQSSEKRTPNTIFTPNFHSNLFGGVVGYHN